MTSRRKKKAGDHIRDHLVYALRRVVHKVKFIRREALSIIVVALLVICAAACRMIAKYDMVTGVFDTFFMKGENNGSY